MEKIESFKVDHKRLLRGIYLSRLDYDNKTGEVMATTFDIRMKLPNREPVLNTAECHAIEHLGATFWSKRKEYQNETGTVLSIDIPNRKYVFLSENGNKMEVKVPFRNESTKKYNKWFSIF